MFREHGYLFALLCQSQQHARMLLEAARQRLDAEDRVVIAHTYHCGGGRHYNSVALSAAELAARDDYGCFALRWQHGRTEYACGIEVDRWLDGGLNVILPASPSALAKARGQYGAKLRVVCAPAPRQSRRWLTDLRSWRASRKQIALDLVLDEELIDKHADAAILLDRTLENAVDQLCFALRQSTPPMAGEFGHRATPDMPGWQAL